MAFEQMNGCYLKQNQQLAQPARSRWCSGLIGALLCDNS